MMLAPWHSVRACSAGAIPTVLLEAYERKVQSLYSAIHKVYRVALDAQEPLTKPRSMQVEWLDDRGRPVRAATVVHPRFLGPPTHP
jgi:hypothetical protein